MLGEYSSNEIIQTKAGRMVGFCFAQIALQTQNRPGHTRCTGRVFDKSRTSGSVAFVAAQHEFDGDFLAGHETVEIDVFGVGIRGTSGAHLLFNSNGLILDGNRFHGVLCSYLLPTNIIYLLIFFSRPDCE